MKNAFLGLLSLVIAFLVLAILGELFLRVNHFAKEAITGNTILKFELEDELGWVGTGGYTYFGELQDAAQQVYPVNITANADGFREFGDPGERRRRKVMFLGDSFTHALQVSDDKTYFRLLGERLDLELFALGVDGYGTLQQYLMLDRYVDRIKPDIVVLQLCPNDFVNNHFRIELNSPRNNNGMRRPYWIDGGVQYRLPRAMPGLRHFANAHSRLLYFILTRLDRLSFKSGARAGETPRGIAGDSEPFRESVAVTQELLHKIRGRVAPSVPVYAFATDSSGPYAQHFRDLSNAAGLHYIEAVPAGLKAARRSGVNIYSADGQHWNNAGHALVADALYEVLKTQ